ncbi:MAG: thiopurine S-methyltransferase [Gammaproteobacteria bacterium]|nr:thiopurine S-methyltransferase [Gammaproteobacteria bacterium]
MKADYWLNHWQAGKIGFHQKRVNSRLMRLWPELEASTDGAVLVPLCGKTLDMVWLHQAGYRVVGVELSQTAIESFFTENNFEYTLQSTANAQVYVGTGHASGISLLQADLFNLKATDVGPISSFYDRASLVAMPPNLRATYAESLQRLVPVGSPGLLISMTYDQQRMQGPPFSVNDEEVRTLLGSGFDLTEIDYSEGPEILGNLADRGLDTLVERVYQLRRR